MSGDAPDFRAVKRWIVIVTSTIITFSLTLYMYNHNVAIMFRRVLTTATSQHTKSLIPALHFSTSPTTNAKPLPPRPIISDADITESFLKGSGPGGQKINKTSSAVQLIHHATGIVVKCQETRSRTTNRKQARRLLQDRIEELELGEGARTKVKEREESERKRSKAKKSRRKYRALEEEKEGMKEEVGGSKDGNGAVEGTIEGREGVGEIARTVGAAGSSADSDAAKPAPASEEKT